MHDIFVGHNGLVARHGLQVRRVRYGQIWRVAVVAHMKLDHETEDTVVADSWVVHMTDLRRRKLGRKIVASLQGAAILACVEGLEDGEEARSQCRHKGRSQVHWSNAVAGESLPGGVVSYDEGIALSVEPLLFS